MLTFSQLTRENLALLSLSAHRKFRWMLLISFKTDFGADRTENRYIGMAWRTDLTVAGISPLLQSRNGYLLSIGWKGRVLGGCARKMEKK